MKETFVNMRRTFGALLIGLPTLLGVGCSDSEEPLLQPTLPATGGDNVRSITYQGGVMQCYDWTFTYTGTRLTRADGTVRDPSAAIDRTFSYTSQLSYQAHGVTVTNSSTEQTQLQLNAQGYIEQMTVNRNIYRFEYNSAGQLTAWTKIVFEDSFGQAQQYRSSATLSYYNGNYDKIVYTDTDNSPVTLTFTPSSETNRNGLLPPTAGKELGCLGFEHLYYAGLLGRPTQNLVASISYAYADGSKDYTTSFEYASQGGNVVLCNYHTASGAVASVNYGY